METRICRCSLLVLCAACLGLSGCYEEEITLNRNGSGELLMHVSVPRQLIQAAQAMGGRLGSGSPLPMAEGELRKQCEGKEGIELKEVRTEEKDQHSHLYATIQFDSLEALNAVMEQRNLGLTREKGVMTFTSALGNGEPIGMPGGGGSPSIPQAPAPSVSGATSTPAGPSDEDRAAARRNYERGMEFKRNKQLRLAASQFRMAISRDPDYLDAHWALAWTAAGLDDKQQAVREFGEVIRLAPAGSEKSQEARKALQRLGGEAPKTDGPSSGPTPPRASAPRPGNPFGAPSSDAMTGMMKSMFGSSTTPLLKLAVHFPGEVLTVEGPGASKQENTASWKVTIGDLLSAAISDQLTMKATAKAGLPWWMFAATGLLLALLAGGGVILVRRRRAA